MPGPGSGVLDPGARGLDQPVVSHSRRAGRHAGHAAEAAVEVPGGGLVQLGTVQDLRHQVNPAPRRVHLLAPQLVGGADRQAEAAVHAIPGQRAQFPGRITAVGRLGGRLYPAVNAHQIPPANRPGAIRWPGSNWSFTERISAAPGTGPHTSTAARTGGEALSTTTLPRAGG